MKKKIIGLLSVLTLLASMITPAEYVNANEPEYTDVGIQESACEAYDELMNSFPLSRSTGEKIYPDYYGGSYINDFGQLVIYVTDMANTPAVLSDIDSSTVVYQQCDYSYSELNELMDILNCYKLQNPDDSIARNFNHYALLDAENRIVVDLDDYSETRIQEFKDHVSSSDAILFVKAEAPMEQYALQPGEKISSHAYDTYYYTGSIGYRAERNGIKGLVTAGHVIGANKTLYQGVGEKVIGKCLVSNVGGSYDAAFCEITDTSTLSNTLYGTSNVLSTAISEPGVGTLVNKIGAATQHTYGKITSINATVSYIDGPTLTNMTEVELYSEKGDSGGIFYSYVSSTNTRYTLGILTGGNSTTTSYSKANEINKGLGTKRY